MKTKTSKTAAKKSSKLVAEKGPSKKELAAKLVAAIGTTKTAAAKMTKEQIEARLAQIEKEALGSSVAAVAAADVIVPPTVAEPPTPVLAEQADDFPPVVAADAANVTAPDADLGKVARERVAAALKSAFAVIRKARVGEQRMMAGVMTETEEELVKWRDERGYAAVVVARRKEPTIVKVLFAGSTSGGAVMTAVELALKAAGANVDARDISAATVTYRVSA